MRLDKLDTTSRCKSGRGKNKRTVGDSGTAALAMKKTDIQGVVDAAIIQYGLTSRTSLPWLNAYFTHNPQGLWGRQA
ncbi:hypothetical protein [Cohnella sp. WQ 127256]|uniref:hypothetical protein n=1 Tax=Cohnella sp. WQ 127256 TaxID=2938790 RepID=UPI0021193DCB|nr:hypothetical protein [Cohnella sp. WQ 127256]